MLDFLLYSILPFLFILGFCITIHEFGHFLFAKLFKIPVEKFSIGFGPPLFRKRIGETDFRIAYFPLGGYVKMAGEDEGEILKKKEKNGDVIMEEQKFGFYDAPIYRRVCVIFSGPLFNILSAPIVLFIIFIIYGVVVNPFMTIDVDEGSYFDRIGFFSQDSIMAVDNHAVENWEELWDILQRRRNNEITITVLRNNSMVQIRGCVDPDSTGLRPRTPAILGSLKQNGPAYNAGMQKNDRILKIDDKEIKTWDEMVEIVRASRNKELFFAWRHNSEIKTNIVTPTAIYDPIVQDTIGQIGIFMPLGRKYLAMLDAIKLAIRRTGELTLRMLEIFYQLLTRKIPFRQIGGPIAIFRLSAESAQWGFEHLLGLLVIISINLGLINLFPIPAFDGGHIIIALIESIRRKRFSKNTRMVIQQIGYAIMLLLIIFVTFNDITR